MKTRNFNKLLSLVLVLMMVVSTMVIMPLTANAASEAVQPAGAGTEAEPYVITSAGNLVWVKNNMATAGTTIPDTTNQRIYMELANDVVVDADFQLQSGVWGSYASYEWHVDGNGYVFSGLTKPLWDAIGSNSTFANFTIANSAITSDISHFGGLVSRVKANTSFINIVMAADVTVTMTGTGHTGAFIGSTGDTNTVFTNCVNNATVISNACAGGFVGAPDQNVTFVNCVNNGNITGGKTETGRNQAAGGFIGLAEGSRAYTFTNCVNNGNITAPTFANSFIGCERPDASQTTTYTNCYNTGSVSISRAAGYASADTITVDNSAKTLEQVMAGITMPNEITMANTSAPYTAETVAVEPALETPGEANSATNRYLVTSAAELAWFQNATADYYLKLMKNIDLGGVHFTNLKAGGTSNVDFDGNGYSIINFYQAATSTSTGLFGATTKNLTITNLHFKNAKITPTTAAGDVGLIVAYIAGSAQVVIDNVTLDQTSLIEGCRTDKAYIGAFFGEHYGTPSITIRNCYNAATVSYAYNSTVAKIGGFGGFTQYSGNYLTIVDSVQAGCVLTGNMTTSYGAIVGEASGARTFTNVYDIGTPDFRYAGTTITATNCYNGAEVTAPENAAAIKAINAVFYAPVITTESKNLEVRLKLTDDFGFMASAKMYAGADEAGFVFSTEAITDANVASLAKVAGAADGDKTYAAYTGLTAATLDTVIYFAAYVTVDGETYYSAAREINCAELAEDLADDGKLGDAVITTNASEIALYAEMVKYHNAYKAYLDSVTPA